jgi:hypothetical protein
LCNINTKVENINNNILTISSEKPIIYKKGIEGFIYQMDKIPRVLGKFKF